MNILNTLFSNINIPDAIYDLLPTIWFVLGVSFVAVMMPIVYIPIFLWFIWIKLKRL